MEPERSPMTNVARAAMAALEVYAAIRESVRKTKPLDLRGKVAIVTGGSRGLGLLMAEELGKQGARVAICGRETDALAVAKSQLEQQGIVTLARACDVGVRGEAEDFVDEVAETWRRLDVVVNNAGIIRVGGLESQSVHDIDEVMRANFWGPVHVTYRALPILTLQGHDARIVNIASIGGRVAVPHLIGYNASKFGLMGFSETMRAELDAKDASPRVVTVVPGLMRTGSFENAEFQGKIEEEFSWFALGSALPLLSIDAREAARRIVAATRDGRPFLRLGLSAHVGDVMHRISPALTTRALSLAARLLPGAGGNGGKPVKGRNVDAPFRKSAFMTLADFTAQANNEEPPS